MSVATPILHMKQLDASPGEKVAVFIPDDELNKSGISKEDVAILGIGGAGMAIIILAGGAVATTALLVSVMTVGSGAILWIKMPATLGTIPGIRTAIKMLPITQAKKDKLLAINWKEKADDYELIVDILVSAGVFLLYGGTLTALIAGGISGLFVSAILRIRSLANKLAKKMESYSLVS